MKRLPPDKQIEVLVNAKGIYNDFINYNIVPGLCRVISEAIDNIYDTNSTYDYNELKKYVPSFNRTHVGKICRKYNLTRVGRHSYWWPTSDICVRIKVLDILIKELEDESRNNKEQQKF
jgi:hypothetical protein